MKVFNMNPSQTALLTTTKEDRLYGSKEEVIDDLKNDLDLCAHRFREKEDVKIISYVKIEDPSIDHYIKGIISINGEKIFGEIRLIGRNFTNGKLCYKYSESE